MAKKRCNGEGSINKRKDGRWECSIMFGFQKDGRRRRKSFYGRTRKEALDKMHDFKQKLEAGLITLDERPLVQPDILFSQTPGMKGTRTASPRRRSRATNTRWPR